MGLSLDQVTDAISKVGNFFLRKDGVNSATANIPMGGNKITGLANGTNPGDAATIDQLNAVAQSGGVRGNIIGAIKNVSGSPKFYYKVSNATAENAAAIDGLYITLEEVVLDAVTYPINSVLKYGSGVWFLDSLNASLGTFDSSAAYADVGGAIAQSSRYQLMFDAYAGHALPNSDIDGWSEGDRMDWNAAYDTSGDNNVGRWVHSQSEAVPDATNLIKGKSLISWGLQALTGVLKINIDTLRGLSWSDSTDNRAFGLNVITTWFEFVGGALGLKDASITLSKLASEVTTYITNAISTAIAALTDLSISANAKGTIPSGNINQQLVALEKRVTSFTITDGTTDGLNSGRIVALGKTGRSTTNSGYAIEISVSIYEGGIAIWMGSFELTPGAAYGDLDEAIILAAKAVQPIGSGTPPPYQLCYYWTGTEAVIFLRRNDAQVTTGIVGLSYTIFDPSGTWTHMGSFHSSGHAYAIAPNATSVFMPDVLRAEFATALATKVTGNAAIAGGTKTKVTFDSKGLVTGGADATQDDIGDGATYKQYSATEKTKLAGIAAGATVNVPYQASQTLGADLTAGTTNLNALNPLPINQQCVQVNINGHFLKYGSEFTVNAGTGVITLDRAEIGYNVLTTWSINISWQGVS